MRLNKSETALLTKNFAKIVSDDWLYRIDGQVNILTKDSLFIAPIVSHLVDNLRSKNPKSIIFLYIHINSICNKFENLCDIIVNNVDVLSNTETKLDYSFANAQFFWPGFHEPLRLDINHQNGGLLVYTKASLLSKILAKFKLPFKIQIISFEINLRKV